MIRILDKLLLFIYSITIATLAVALFFIGINVYPRQALLKVFMQIDGTWDPFQIGVVIFAAIVFLVSLRFFFVAIRRGTKKPKAIESRNELGDILISLDTLESLTLRATLKHRGVREPRARIVVTPAGAEIVIKTLVDGDRAIPQLSQEIQSSVQSLIEEVTGVAVASVSVFITNVTSQSATRSRVD